MAGGHSRACTSRIDAPSARRSEARERGMLARWPGSTPTTVTAGIPGSLAAPSGFRTIAGLSWPIRRALGVSAPEHPDRTMERIAVEPGLNKAPAVQSCSNAQGATRNEGEIGPSGASEARGARIHRCLGTASPLRPRA